MALVLASERSPAKWLLTGSRLHIVRNHYKHLRNIYKHNTVRIIASCATKKHLARAASLERQPPDMRLFKIQSKAWVRAK